MVEHILLMVECVFVLCTTFALVIKTNSITNYIKKCGKRVIISENGSY